MIVLTLFFNALLVLFAAHRSRWQAVEQGLRDAGVTGEERSWLLLNRHLLQHSLLLKTYKWGILVQSVCGITCWCWALHFPLLPRIVYRLGATTAFLHNVIVLLGTKPLPAWVSPPVYAAAVLYPAAWFTQLMWLTVPVLPFVLIWVYATPLPAIAPGITEAVVHSSLPAVLLLLSAVSLLQSVCPMPGMPTDTSIISMLHRQAGIALPGGVKGTKRVSYGVSLRHDARYVRIMHVADPSIGGATPAASLRSFLSARLHDLQFLPDAVCLTGDIVSPLFALLFSPSAVHRALDDTLAPLRAASPPVVVAMDDVQALIVGSYFEDRGFARDISGGRCVQVEVRGTRVILSSEGAPRVPGDLRVLLGTSVDSFCSGAEAAAHHVTLASAHYGGLVQPSPLPLLINKVLRRQVPQEGLWGLSSARLHVSRGLGCPGNPPPFPCLRLGSLASVPLLHVEVPPRG